MPGELRSFFGQCQPLFAALEESVAKIGFYFFDMIADRALTYVQKLGRAGDISSLRSNAKHLNRFNITDYPHPLRFLLFDLSDFTMHLIFRYES